MSNPKIYAPFRKKIQMMNECRKKELQTIANEASAFANAKKIFDDHVGYFSKEFRGYEYGIYWCGLFQVWCEKNHRCVVASDDASKVEYLYKKAKNENIKHNFLLFLNGKEYLSEYEQRHTFEENGVTFNLRFPYHKTHIEVNAKGRVDNIDYFRSHPYSKIDAFAVVSFNEYETTSNTPIEKIDFIGNCYESVTEFVREYLVETSDYELRGLKSFLDHIQAMAHYDE